MYFCILTFQDVCLDLDIQTEVVFEAYTAPFVNTMTDAKNICFILALLIFASVFNQTTMVVRFGGVFIERLVIAIFKSYRWDGLSLLNKNIY